MTARFGNTGRFAATSFDKMSSEVPVLPWINSAPKSISSLSLIYLTGIFPYIQYSAGNLFCRIPPAACRARGIKKAPAPRILSWGREPWLRGATPVHRRLAASASAGTNAESPARKSFPGTVTGAPAAAYWGRVFLPGTYIPASAAVTCRERDFMPILASFQGSASLSALRFLPGIHVSVSAALPFQDRTSLQDAAHQIPPPVRCSAPRPVQPISSPRSHHPGFSVKVSIGLLSLFIAFEHVFVDILFSNIICLYGAIVKPVRLQG